MHLDQLPRYPLAQLPTPIQSLPALTRALGGPTLLIKRDDQTGLAFGGFKSYHPKSNMKTLRNALLIGLAALVISQAWAEDSEAAKKEMAQLQGKWSMVSGSTDGQPVPDQVRKQMKRVCKKDEATTTMGVQVILKAKITIDPTKKPKAIDYEMTGGPNKGKTQLGIYELDRDTFKSCFSAPGDPRPTDFTSKPDDHRTLTVWKREQAATPLDQK